MKREIKFRAWDKETECYLYNIQDAYDTLSGHVKYEDGENADYDADCFGDFLDNDRYVVEQFTGLKDKNGREIYEGDVLDIGLLNQDGNPVLAPVSYEAYLAGYVLDNRGYGIWQRLGGDCEVIGNIYENPELLKADK
jgi:hypothetical protein